LTEAVAVLEPMALVPTSVMPNVYPFARPVTVIGLLAFAADVRVYVIVHPSAPLSASSVTDPDTTIVNGETVVMLTTVNVPAVAQSLPLPSATVTLSPSRNPAVTKLVEAINLLPVLAADVMLIAVADSTAVAVNLVKVWPPVSAGAANETSSAPPVETADTLTEPGNAGTRPGTTPPLGSLAGTHVLVATPPGHDA
jgi:hypothetical protein